MKPTYGIIKLAAVAGRADAAHRSEMVTQLIFGEAIKILKQKNEWFFVENVADGYQCWILRFSFETLDEVAYTAYASHKTYLTFDPVSKLKVKGHETLYVPCSSILPFFDPETNQGHIGNKIYTFEGNIVPAKQKPNAEKILVKANKMINAPYLWGGKTAMGIDCSGFTQSIYKVCGMQLPRDAYQQAEMGLEVALKDARGGDLAFFANDEGKITHVGILMGNGKIIHASGKVKVCKIDDTGIFDGELNDYSHKLSVIKRVI
ncbi:MAG: C40 family peptidase [Sphingobacteriales bacterium JAD_PAG50586_3]|nr:MAG: C40 family peptidase [Sphingobacteriales bacterium JAD_PAG50586_3]